MLRAAGPTNVPTLPGPRPPARSRASQHGRLSPLARAVRASSYALRCKIWVTSASVPRSRDTRSRVAAFKVSARPRNSDGHSASLGAAAAFMPERRRAPTSGKPFSKSRGKPSSGAFRARPRPAVARARAASLATPAACIISAKRNKFLSGPRTERTCHGNLAWRASPDRAPADASRYRRAGRRLPFRGRHPFALLPKLQGRLAPLLQELVANLARRHRRTARRPRERRYLADSRQVCRPGGVAKRAHARPLVVVGEERIHGGFDLIARAFGGSNARWRARASSNAQPASWICWGHSPPPPPPTSSPDPTSAACAVPATGGAVPREAQLRRLLPLGRRPAPRCTLTAVGRVQWGGPVACATGWCSVPAGARVRARARIAPWAGE